MAKKKVYKIKSSNKKAKEPVAKYGSGKKLSKLFEGLKISTMAEQEEEMREYSASLTAVERMAYLYQLNQIAFAHLFNSPSKKLWDKTIHIDKSNLI